MALPKPSSELRSNSIVAMLSSIALTLFLLFYPIAASLRSGLTITAVISVTMQLALICWFWFYMCYDGGFCYEAIVGNSSLGWYPMAADLREEMYLKGVTGWFTRTGEDIWHAHSDYRVGAVGIEEVPGCHYIGSYAEFQAFTKAAKRGATHTAEQAYNLAANTAPTTQYLSQMNTMINNLRAELTSRPLLPKISLPSASYALQEHDSQPGRTFDQEMDRISAMEAAKVLLSGMESLGSAQERMEIVKDTFKTGIPTSVAPSDPNYSKLVRMLGPLRYRPRVEAHAVAATIRRSAMSHASRTLNGAIVGLISPSKQEVHTFPNAVIWDYTDNMDLARRNKHCSTCALPQCALVSKLEREGRILTSNNWQRAAHHFARHSVTSLVLMNIEPNIDARELCKLMVAAGVYNAYSLVSVDWRVLLGQKCYDTLTGMTTEHSFGKVVSSFHDGGDYVQSLTKVRQLFAPTFANGHALRRTTIFADHATHYQEITLVNGGWATRCVPAHDKYYFIKVIMPDGTRPVIPVERHGFDRVLATYRTQAIKDRGVARIVLRQAVVTYSISGTQVTPRIALTQAQSEALAIWIEIYSEVQDAYADAQSQRMRPQTVSGVASKGLYAAVSSTLIAATPGSMSLGSVSAVEAFLRAYRSEFGEMTIEQMSERALEEHFGTKLDPLSLQNAVISTWRSMFGWIINPKEWLKKISLKFKDSWNYGFGYVDVVAVMGLLGVQYSIAGVAVAMDCLKVVARINGHLDALPYFDKFLSYVQWQEDKAKRFWVTVQSAQDLDFQAACIDIVETFFNVFSIDHAAAIQEVREKALIPEDMLAELQLNAALPYSDFLSELKLFLGKFNSHAKRLSMAAMLLNAFDHDRREASPTLKAQLIHTIKAEVKDVKVDLSRKLGWSLTDLTPECADIPLKPIDNQDIRESFERGTIDIPTGDGDVTLTRLRIVDGKVDLGPIHALMELQHGDNVRPENLRGPNYISPDAQGAELQQKLVAYVAELGIGASFCRREHVQQWHTMALNGANIDYVAKVLRTQADLFDQPSQTNWIAHMTGLAMGGKSKGFESWITSNDLVVVPTERLKTDWQTALGKLDPIRRAAVVTQHAALEVKYAARYVLIDECYAFDPEHLQAIANRQSRSKGVITIGDKRQISNVFSPTGLQMRLQDVPCVMITPTTFVPWDVAAVYINNTVTDVFVDNLFCGGQHANGLQYTLNADDVLMPGEGDLAIQGTQVGKEIVNARGVECNTTHECQGRRSNVTVVHTVGRALTGDLFWLTRVDQSAHLGVTVTRAREKTIFVVNARNDLRVIPWFDDTVINGTLPSTVIYGGTSWDFIDPLAESESTWEHIREACIVQSHLDEVALTDPIKIGTVFASGEAISTSEIRSNVELVSGVTFTDEAIPQSDKFDNYCTMPRDHPGADQNQALTRAGPDVKPTLEDYVNAEAIVNTFFEEVIDKKIFFSHVANSRRAALTRLTRQQAIDGCYAGYESRASTYSYAFLKPEYSKKPSEMPGELKAQGVVTASAMQQLMFSDVCDALTHAWARAMRPGKLSPVGFHEEEVEQFLTTFEHSYELDIEKQDSSHKPVHIIVASIMINLAADKLGLGELAKEIRSERTVRMMGSMFKFVLNNSLASGDPWTLIINKIMAWSALVSVANVSEVRACQSGDDITLDREPPWREHGLNDQISGNAGIVWKQESREQRRNGVTFISRAVLPNNTVVYKALRTILKYMVKPRNQIQHAGITADAARIRRLSAVHGLQAYAEARAQVWGGDALVIYDMWVRALTVAAQPFDALPEELKRPEPRQYTVRSRDGGCFGFALANCVSTNVQAINAIATYRGAVNQTEALHACRDNKVPIIFINEPFAKRSKRRLQDQMDRRNISRSFVVAYEDHALAVVPNTITVHGGFGKRQITWKFSHSREVEITDFE